MPEHLQADFDSIAPEAACTSMQLHLQVHPDSFAGYWNAAQCLAGVQLAVGANSPFLLGSRLWAETRIPLFEQSCDVRTPELRNQGVRPRVWFGERWITSILDLFTENARYFPALLPVTEETDPEAELAAGRVPELTELRLHNGTIWRWNRPVYDIADGVPHVRVENRVLPAGPTPVDMVANALFFYGLLRVLVEADRPLWSLMSFEAAEENFTTAARLRHGRPAVLAGLRLDPARRAGAAQAAAAGRGRARPLGCRRRRDRPLPVGDRATLRDPADRGVVAAGRGGRAGTPRGGPADRTARDDGPLPGGVDGQRAGAHLGAAGLSQAPAFTIVTPPPAFGLGPAPSLLRSPRSVDLSTRRECDGEEPAAAVRPGPEPDRSAAEPEWPPILLDDGWPDTGGGPATRAARPAPLRSPTDDPPTDPHGWPAVRDVDPPRDSAPLVSLPFTAPSPEARLTQVAAARSLLVDRAAAGTIQRDAPGRDLPGSSRGRLPWPPAEQAEAAGLAAAFAADFLSWDESDPARRGRVLAGYLGVPGPDPARLGWDGTGRQRAEFAVPGRVVVDGAGRLLVDVRVRVTPVPPGTQPGRRARIRNRSRRACRRSRRRPPAVVGAAWPRSGSG